MTTTLENFAINILHTGEICFANGLILILCSVKEGHYVHLSGFPTSIENIGEGRGRLFKISCGVT